MYDVQIPSIILLVVFSFFFFMVCSEALDFNFEKSHLSIFFFCHLSAWCHILETIAYSAIVRFTPMPFSKSFIVSALTFRSLNRHALNFVRAGRAWGPRCILLHVEIQSS